MPHQINEQYKELEQFVLNLPTDFDKGGETIYKIRNEVKIFEVAGLRVNVKSYRVPNLINQFVYRFFRPSKAKRAYAYASRLMEKQVETPAPIAWLECHKGLKLRQSFFVTIQYGYDFTLRDVFDGDMPNREEIIRGFVDYTVDKMHRNGFFHMDYSAGNILIKKVDSGYEYSVIDLNRMVFLEIDAAKGLENLKQLNTTAANYEIIGKRYAELTELDEQYCIDQIIEMDRKYQEFRANRQRLKGKLK